MSLVLLLCLPLLAATVFADTQYVFDTLSDGVYVGSLGDAPLPGDYQLDGYFDYYGSVFILPSLLLTIDYYHADSDLYTSVSSYSLDFMGSVVSASVIVTYSVSERIFDFLVMLDDGTYVPGVYTLTPLFAYEDLLSYSFDLNVCYPGFALPPEGRYHAYFLIDGESFSLPLELFYSDDAFDEDSISFISLINFKGSFVILFYLILLILVL